MRKLIVAFLLLAACGGSAQKIDTGSDEPVEVQDHDGNVDRYKEYTECVRENGADACPTPAEMLDD